jgi:hypothetical protein
MYAMQALPSIFMRLLTLCSTAGIFNCRTVIAAVYGFSFNSFQAQTLQLQKFQMP